MTMSDTIFPRRVLVTGAAGFIGGHLCNRLAESFNCEVVGVDNLRSGDWSRCSALTTSIEADITDISADDWTGLFSGVDIVFHLAAEKYNSSRSSPGRLLETNLVATERLFRAAAECAVKRVVFTSSLYAYGSVGPEEMRESDLPQPSTLYGVSKLAGEHMLVSINREIPFSWNVARLFFIYGPKQFADGGYKSVINRNFERILAREAPRINGDGRQELDYVYVDDCIRGLIAIGTSATDHKVVNLSSGFGLSINELTELMIRISETDINPVSSEPDWTAGSRRVGVNLLAQQTFGWSPKVDIETGLRETFTWLVSQVDS